MDPIIGISCDVVETAAGPQCRGYVSYVRAVIEAGATPILLPPDVDQVERQLEICDGFVLTGGDDPLMESFGVATDTRATPVHPLRQDHELALLDALAACSAPVLGVCLGMQLMALHAGGSLDQHLPDSLPDEAHWDAEHEVTFEERTGMVFSRHRQAVVDAGSLEVVARAPDGVVEAVRDPKRAFRVGVQWHPERTAGEFGGEVFRGLVEASRGQRSKLKAQNSKFGTRNSKGDSAAKDVAN